MFPFHFFVTACLLFLMRVVKNARKSLYNGELSSTEKFQSPDLKNIISLCLLRRNKKTGAWRKESGVGLSGWTGSFRYASVIEYSDVDQERVIVVSRLL